MYFKRLFFVGNKFSFYLADRFNLFVNIYTHTVINLLTLEARGYS